MNLFKNAIEATNTSPITNTVTFSTSYDMDHEQIIVILSDKGIGISEDKLATIWNPSTSTSSKQKGSGLGLSVVKRIVDEHQGRIEVTSEIDKGTTFTIYFPVIEKTKSV